MARKESPLAGRRIGGGLFERTDTVQEPEPAKPARIKRTFHLEPDTVLLLDELQLAQHRATGKKPELSTLVSEAIRLLGAQRSQDV